MSRFTGCPFRSCVFTLALLCLISPVACEGATEPEASPTPLPATPTQVPPRATPVPPLAVEALKNAEYQSEWPKNGVAKLDDGTYTEEIVPGSASKLVITLYADMYAFGDLDDDGVQDAAVVLATSGGGSGSFISLEAVINEDGAPKHAASTLLGDRVQVKSVSIESGVIVVDMITHGLEDPMCCPTLEVTDSYRLEGDVLSQVVQGGG